MMEPVRKSVTVAAPLEVAFRIFVEMKRWWPLGSHHVGEAKAIDAIVEPREGGRWYEKGEDGSECDWGRVLAWEPPRRLVLAWQLDADFRFDPRLHTEVELRFSPEGPTRTRVELEHRLLDAYGERAASLRGVFDSDGGWSGLLRSFEQAALPSAYLCRLIPPRATFAADMSDAERKVMADHAAYWSGLLERQVALLFGPVADPAGGWGVGVLRVSGPAHLEELQRDDPAIRAGIGMRYEAFPMPRLVTRL